MGTKTGAPSMLAALAITDGRQPLASDLGVPEAAADSPVLPLRPIDSGRLTLAPTPTEPLPSPAPLILRRSTAAGTQAAQAAQPIQAARHPPRPVRRRLRLHAASAGGEPHYGCCSPAIVAFAHANPFLLLAETGNSCQGGSLACLCVPTAFGFPHGQELRARRASRLAPR